MKKMNRIWLSPTGTLGGGSIGHRYRTTHKAKAISPFSANGHKTTGLGERIKFFYKGEYAIKLSEPKMITFWIAVVLGGLGIIAMFITSCSAYVFWLVLVGLIVLVLGNLIKGMWRAGSEVQPRAGCLGRQTPLTCSLHANSNLKGV
jgi:hypothetical protein